MASWVTNISVFSQTFDEASLCESLKKNVSKSGYVKPTPVQKHGIPIIAAGRDLMACAQTGSGKTVRWDESISDLWVLFVDRVNVYVSSSRLLSCSRFCSSWWQTAWRPVPSVSCRSLKPSSWPQPGSSSTRSTLRRGSLPMGMLRMWLWQSDEAH